MMDKSLPLDLNYFEKIVVYNAIFDQIYLETILDYVEPIFFRDKNIQTVFKVLKRFYIEHKVVPNLTEFKAHLATPEERESLKEVVHGFKTIDQNYNKELLLRNTERFLREKSVLNTVVETSIDVNSGNIDSAKILKQFEKACGLSLTDNIGMDYLEDIDKHCKDLQQVFNTISSGWKWLDKQIGGGFMADGRALYCFFGVTNVGKSIFLGNIATNIINQDKTVVLISLEMPEQIYAKRISAQLSRIPANDLRLQVDPLRNFVNQYKIKNRKAKLIIKEFPPKSITVLGIKTYINKLVSKGIKPDAIVIDYINLIAPMVNGLGSYEAIKQITEGIRALSYDFECPVISATQANRAAVGEAQPDMGKTGESMGLSHTVDAQFSIWSQEGDSDLGIIHIGIEKNRFGPREVYSHLNIDYPTLSLTEPSDVVAEFSVKGNAPKLSADIESTAMESSILDTLNMIDNIAS
jgi:replicative DNA helicase